MSNISSTFQQNNHTPANCARDVTGCDGSSDARRLYDDLLKKSGYNKLIRPVQNNSDRLTVKVGLKLSQLIDVVSANAS